MFEIWFIRNYDVLKYRRYTIIFFHPNKTMNQLRSGKYNCLASISELSSEWTYQLERRQLPLSETTGRPMVRLDPSKHVRLGRTRPLRAWHLRQAQWDQRCSIFVPVCRSPCFHCRDWGPSCALVSSSTRGLTYCCGIGGALVLPAGAPLCAVTMTNTYLSGGL